ncbi:MAG: MMPL family transporter [Chitinophagaceae bacterium]|nr:MMPL family transporter [Chitinophagaceae bacterium]
MWQRLGKLVLRFRGPLLILLLLITAVMGFYASKVKMSYEFSKAIPTDNAKYLEYVSFKQKFGDDGNMLVTGIQTDSLFTLKYFNAYKELQQQLKKIKHVEDIVSIPSAIKLATDTATGKLAAQKIFPDLIQTQQELDSVSAQFFNLPFYKQRLYNPESNAYLMGVRINKDVLNSKGRTQVINDVINTVKKFEEKTGLEVHLSGLPLIRTVVADRIQNEMKYFLFGSLLLSTIILALFFRSFSTTLLSLLVVILGVVWSVGVLYLCGYQVTLLTALIPCLVVVIGIPNCIYFINKYHTSYIQSGDKEKSLVDMVSKMGVVTLFCNLTAAIGFAVFALTRSAILREFGVVAGISIMIIFVVSFILLPAALSYLPAPKPSQTKYLNNRWITHFLLQTEKWVFHHKKIVYGVTTIVLIFAVLGIFKLKSVSYIVDDLPKTDKVYTDIKFFEKHFGGVMPLEIVIDTKKPKGIISPKVDVHTIAFFQDSFLVNQENVSKPLSVIDGIKFFYQAASEGTGDSSFTLPAFGNPLYDLHKQLLQLNARRKNNEMTASDSATSKLMGSFVDSSEQYLRISMSMADIGTQKLPPLLDTIQKKANEIFDTATYKVQLTGTSITFLEGSRFIVNGLKDSIFWAFLLIALCMLYLFKSARILLCSLIPNLIPLVITAGIMGWAGVPLKPSTVLVFSVALGIAVDITIRFLVNYKQELPAYNYKVPETVSATIKNTGLSIVYTALVLIAGFIIFCASGFGGTKALGWLTSATLLIATLTNLVLLPVLLLLFAPKKTVIKKG